MSKRSKTIIVAVVLMGIYLICSYPAMGLFFKLLVGIFEGASCALAILGMADWIVERYWSSPEMEIKIEISEEDIL